MLLQTRSQLIEAAENACSLGGSSCKIRLRLIDQLSCYDDNRLVYVAGVGGTASTSAASFVDHLRQIAPIEISLHNQTFSVMSSSSCPLSIPSAEESNCNRETGPSNIVPTSATATTAKTTTSTTTDTITSTSDTTSHTTTTTITATTTNATATTTDSNIITTIDNDHDSTAAGTTTSTDNADKNDTVVVVVTIACLVGIVVMTFGIICFIVICHQCNRYRHCSSK